MSCPSFGAPSVLIQMLASPSDVQIRWNSHVSIPLSWGRWPSVIRWNRSFCPPTCVTLDLRTRVRCHFLAFVTYEGGGRNFSKVKQSVRQCIDHTETVILRLSCCLLVWVVQNNSNFFQDTLQQNSNMCAGIFRLAHGLLKSTQKTWMSELFWASCTVLMLKTRPDFCWRQNNSGRC